ncbi:LysR family transcriptional regulator [Roseibium algae]|uniref:LysR family transcriptional regulator n=1 Tax=Roseibium algae TaxID=3123038 RepID=A0ABU8TNH3_9HYPH
MDKWTELRTAYQVAKLGTVSAAAETLGFHRATVNRHIDLLEEELGARIFIRHARGYTLTELGEDALRVAQKTDDLMEDLAGRVRGEKAELSGEIKVTILLPLMKALIGPVARFRSENPNCRVNVIASEELERLEYGDAHVALRVGRKPDHPDYVVTPRAPVGLNLYAHDRYVERKGLPFGADQLEGHEFVLPVGKETQLPFTPWVAENIDPSQVALASNHPFVVTEAVMSGLGLGFLSDLDVAGRTDLHAVLPVNNAWSIPLWIVTHVDLHRTEKVQAMLTCLKDG